MLPLSDGGEGFVKSLVSAKNGAIVTIDVEDPFRRQIESYYGLINEGQTAVIEMALASGLELIKEEEKNPWKATTYGTGQLISDAIDKGCKQILIGLGGSATNDGGVGVLQALGGKALDSEKRNVEPGANTLSEITCFDLSELRSKTEAVEFIAACDVTNPLLGLDGASAIYGPQKGADDQMVSLLDDNLAHLDGLVQKELSLKNAHLPGAGAAGGLGYGLVTFLGAELKSGFDIVSEATGLEEKVKWADLIITGEGKIDHQTLQGKTIHRLAKLAKVYQKKLIAIGGAVDLSITDHFKNEGISESFALIDYASDLKDAMENPGKYLSIIAEQIGKHYD